MDEKKRAGIEELVVELAKKHPQKVTEVWYNPSHLNPDEGETERDSYFFICTPPAFEQKLFDEMTLLMMRVYSKMKEDIALFPIPLNAGFQRRIYSRDEKQ